MPDLDISNYKSFVYETTNSIIPQIQNLDNLTLFGHKIPFQFRVDLILNLPLLSDINDDLIQKFLPFFKIKRS